VDVFISWSGRKSLKVAFFLHSIIFELFSNKVKPFVSEKDIDPGDIWFTTIKSNIIKSRVGIVCITEENKNKPWLLFEAGALAGGEFRNVCTFLVDLKSSRLVGPLSHFNHTFSKRDGIFHLMKYINSRLNDETRYGNDEFELKLSKLWEGKFERIYKIMNRESQLIPPHSSREKDLKLHLDTILRIDDAYQQKRELIKIRGIIENTEDMLERAKMLDMFFETCALYFKR